MKIDNKLYQDIKEFCELNEMETDNFINKILKEAFLIEKYGDSPFSRKNTLNDENDISKNEITNIPITVTSVTITDKSEKEEVIKEKEIHENYTIKQENEIKENLNENIKKPKKKRNLK